MENSRGRPFLELFASALHEDYRFPILEVFAFLYTLGAFAVASFAGAFVTGASSEGVAYFTTSSLLGFPLFIFAILVFKNIAFGLGSDIEKGIIQTFLSYPIKRRWILSAKLLSALGISLLLFLGIQTGALYVLAPGIVGPHLGTVLLTYAAGLSSSLLSAGIVLLISLVLKRGGLAVVFGIVFYFGFSIFTSLLTFVAILSGSALPLQAMSVISPNIALGNYYQTVFSPFSGGDIWKPSFADVLGYLAASYAIVVSVFLLGYQYFSRRLGV